MSGCSTGIYIDLKADTPSRQKGDASIQVDERFMKFLDTKLLDLGLNSQDSMCLACEGRLNYQLGSSFNTEISIKESPLGLLETARSYLQQRGLI